MQKRLTKSLVESLPPDGKWTWDTDLRGLGVRRQGKDAVYCLKTRVKGRVRWFTIGRHGSPWTPDTARGEAHRLLGSIHAGIDPAKEREAKRAEERTVSDMLDRYLKEHVAKFNRPSTAAEARRQVEKDIRPFLGKIPVTALTRTDVKTWHDSFGEGGRGGPYTGNRALAWLRKALTLASVDWEWRPDNPARGIRLYPETKRERFFNDAELAAIGAALTSLETEGRALPGAYRAVRLLALTGMRLGEVLGLRWAWIDAKLGCLYLPDAKAGARTVPLGQPALDYLATLERIGPFVCVGSHPDRPISKGGFYDLWYPLRDKAGLENARAHDFRHTVGTLSAQSGANAFIVRDVLGHKTLAMTGRYVARHVDPLRKTADDTATRIAYAMGTKLPN